MESYRFSMTNVYLGTYKSRCSHISGVDSLAGFFDSCGKLAALIQTKAIPYSAKFHVILRIIYHGEGGGSVTMAREGQVKERGGNEI